MKILVIGSGAREHALVWACSRSKLGPEIFCAPGNGGTLRFGQNVPVSAEDVDGLVSLVRREKFDLTIVGPEAPLAGGLVDQLVAEGFLVFGPTAGAARIETSKAFAKELMMLARIPTADFGIFKAMKPAEEYIRRLKGPVVVKASGLAAGKGAIVCQTTDQAIDTARRMIEGGEFGEAGRTVVIEEFLAGVEVSMTAIADGTDYLLLPPARDHKAVFDGGKGPMTGGMGAIAPLDQATNDNYAAMAEGVIRPLLQDLAKRGHPFRGFLYPGLMVNDQGFKVLEVNCRLGDPEAQVLLPLFGADLLEVMLAAAQGQLAAWMNQYGLTSNDWRANSRHGMFAATVVAAAGGYPGPYEKGKVIDDLPEETMRQITFQAGTKQRDGSLVTAGGRVLSVTGLGNDLKSAVDLAYSGMNVISFEGKHCRTDIGASAL